MKRYAMDWYMESTLNGPACNATMMETPSGEWVRYEDAQDETQRLQKTLAVSVEHQLALANKFAELQGENERLRAALGGMLRSYFLVINDPLMEQRNSLRAFILGVFSGDPQAATDALAIPPNT